MASEITQRVTTETELDLDREDGPAIDYNRLYRLWEASNWSATSIDFSQDIIDWREKLTPNQRQAARWNYALFLHGEEAVARTLAPFVTAVQTQEQRIFLTTQIVDEARHHVFFDRFTREVIGEGHDFASALESTRPELNWGFKRIFGELDRITDRLRLRPRDRVLLAQCFMLYHIVIEGALAHPGQHFIQTYLTERGVMPGFTQGIAAVSRDESRHMAYGIQALHDLLITTRGARKGVIALLNRALPWMVSVLVPPNFDEDYVRVFGLEMTDIFDFGLRSLETKLARVGVKPTEVRSLVQIGASEPVSEQSRRIMVLLRTGVIGDAMPLRLTDEAITLIFDGLERVVNMRPVKSLSGPIQWEFANAEPWYLLARDGRAEVHQGRANLPALTLQCSIEDWARIASEKLDPRWAMVTRRLRLSGDMSLALRLPTLIGG
ncbi:MAG: ribonucleotide-diphosphate reductase subunit beta [Ktedonobacterales bacterium]